MSSIDDTDSNLYEVNTLAKINPSQQIKASSRHYATAYKGWQFAGLLYDQNAGANRTLASLFAVKMMVLEVVNQSKTFTTIIMAGATITEIK